MIVAQIFQVNHNRTYVLAIAVRLHMLNLHLQIIDASQNIERDNLIPDWVIISRHFLGIGIVLLDAEADASIDRSSGVGRIKQLTSINDVH